MIDEKKIASYYFEWFELYDEFDVNFKSAKQQWKFTLSFLLTFPFTETNHSLFHVRHWRNLTSRFYSLQIKSIKIPLKAFEGIRNREERNDKEKQAMATKAPTIVKTFCYTFYVEQWKINANSICDYKYKYFLLIILSRFRLNIFRKVKNSSVKERIIIIEWWKNMFMNIYELQRTRKKGLRQCEYFANWFFTSSYKINSWWNYSLVSNSSLLFSYTFKSKGLSFLLDAFKIYSKIC